MGGSEGHPPEPLRIGRLGVDDGLSQLAASDQRDYLLCYLHDLEVRWVVEERNYFDRDYLAAFKAFYCESARGYPNVCRRLTFFTAAGCDMPEALRTKIETAVGGGRRALQSLNGAFRGFIVLRPIRAPLGRTVVGWYPDTRAGVLPRVIAPCREYDIHIAGLRLSIQGVAWQQQDSAVAACATIGLWSMLQSSVFRDRIALPTTADITRSAHRTASLGERIFPSSGLNNHHLLEAIKEQGVEPLLLNGDLVDDYSNAFSRKRFSSTVAMLLRSGFPILLLGSRGDEGHVVCAVGFRPRPPGHLPPGSFEEEDACLDHLYIHDDTLGPNVRFAIEEATPDGPVTLIPDAPEPRHGLWPVENPTDDVEAFVPRQMAVAVVPELRLSPDGLHNLALDLARDLSIAISGVQNRRTRQLAGVHFSLLLIRQADYIGATLASSVPQGKPLAAARLGLVEEVEPLSLYLAVIRLSMAGRPLMDVLFDTSDAAPGLSPIAHVIFDRGVEWLLEKEGLGGRYGHRVRGY